MKLKSVLRKLRTASKLSMSQVHRLALKAKDPRSRVTQGYLSRLESGKEDNPSMKKIRTLCRIYEVDPNAIFMGE